MNLSGVGCPDLGVILVMPTTGEVEARLKEYGSEMIKQKASRVVYFVARFSKPADSFGTWKKMPFMKAEEAWSKSSGKFKYYEGFTNMISGDTPQGEKKLERSSFKNKCGRRYRRSENWKLLPDEACSL